jgi:hypothetical protein
MAVVFLIAGAAGRGGSNDGGAVKMSIRVVPNNNNDARRRARGVFVQSVVIPVVAALIAAGATLAAPAMSPSTSPSSSTSPLGATTVMSPDECAIYEEGFLVPLARINYKIVVPLLSSHSSINYSCGLIPSPSPSPSIVTVIPTSFPSISPSS